MPDRVRHDNAVKRVSNDGTGATYRQLPRGAEIFLDHVGHFVPDVERASEALSRAGFAPTPMSIQVNPDPAGGPDRPTGTGNVTAMLAAGYLEVLFKTADTPLGREFDAALARYPGLHIAAFSVADAGAAHRRLAANGFRMQPLVDMRRPAATEEGPATAGFTIARVEPGQMPEGRIQILTHRTEDVVWQKRWLTHPNGATGLAGLVIAVPDVDEATARFARFLDHPATAQGPARLIALDRGSVLLVDAPTFAAILPGMKAPALPFMGAYVLTVASLAHAEAVLRAARLAILWLAGGLLVPFPKQLGYGAWLFVEDAADWLGRLLAGQ